MLELSLASNKFYINSTKAMEGLLVLKNKTNLDYLKYSLNATEKVSNLYYEQGKTTDFIKIFLILNKRKESVNLGKSVNSKVSFSESVFVSEKALDENYFIAEDNNILIYGIVFSLLGFFIFVVICILILIKIKKNKTQREEREKEESKKHIYHSKVSETLDRSINKSDFERKELIFNMKSIKERKNEIIKQRSEKEVKAKQQQDSKQLFKIDFQDAKKSVDLS